MAGIDPAKLDDFGQLRSTDGDVIDLGALAENEIVISETMQDDLDASVGDGIGFFYNNQPVILTIAGIGEDFYPQRGDSNPTTPGMVMPLDRLQELTGIQDEITAVAVSNTGDIRSGMELTDQVTDNDAGGLRRPRHRRLTRSSRIQSISPILISSVFTTFFLLFGLFSIGVGILLIVLIFSMLCGRAPSRNGNGQGGWALNALN